MPKEALDAELLKHAPDIYMAMIDTADIVAERYKLSREYQDEFSLESQRRMAAAQQANKFKDEIVPMKTKMKVVDKETKEESIVDYMVTRDECNRPDTTMEGLAKLEPVKGPGKYITAGNASQLSDGAAAVVLMEAKEAEKRGLEPMGRFVSWAVAGCEPDEMGIGPVFAVPKLLKRQGLKIDDIDLWELNEAFASQCLYCRDRLGIDPAKYNVNGGSIAIGHPFGMTGARLDRPHPAGRPPPQGQVGRRHHVHRRRPGRRGPVRDLLRCVGWVERKRNPPFGNTMGFACAHPPRTEIDGAATTSPRCFLFGLSPPVIASEAKQSSAPVAARWIASSLRSQ